MAAPPRDSGRLRSISRRVLRFLARRPVLCLVLLTPGIPEYLSGSTSFLPLASNPFGFLLGLAFNVALYGSGVLLIREATVRWHKGWATVLTLGVAYAILEEGIAVDTFFYARANPVGVLGFYGHWLGVNWVWATELSMFHALVSIALPIFLLGVALPATEGQRFLTGRQIGLVIGILGLDVLILDAFVARTYHFWPGVPLTFAGLALIAGLVALGYRLPRDLLRPAAGPPKGPLWACWTLGAVLLTGSILIEQVGASAGIPAAGAVLALLGLYGGVFVGMVRLSGARRYLRPRLAFAVGAVSPVIAIGLVSERAFPVLLVAIGVAFAFFGMLWTRHPDPDRVAPALASRVPSP